MLVIVLKLKKQVEVNPDKHQFLVVIVSNLREYIAMIYMYFEGHFIESWRMEYPSSIMESQRGLQRSDTSIAAGWNAIL